ncbi:diphosphomevalonate decarboxylase [Rhizoctonia solani]|uniref:Diphosphomevalonate decarboxylase n=1 Tax=Rhizoctonia solani TaxID=456999 RepID=A0A8H7IGC1_9AGAM|nr:diphosphomevalonate decarboxylase [Rhizoctonia solani]
MAVYQATATAPVNIACIKYWGKRDTKLILPTNSSLSVTLDQDHLRSTTTSRADASFTQDRLWLNGKEDEIKQGGRLATCIAEMKRLRATLEESDSSKPKISGYNVHIASYNNFPTAAGLASSASGFAALVASLAQLTNFHLPPPSCLPSHARAPPDGSDSFAVQVATKDHWPDLHALICVVNDAKKGTSSTAGMQRTVENFSALAAPNRACGAAADEGYHRAIVALVEEFNRASGKIRAAYTYDAGPNAVIYAPKENLKEIVNLIVKYFPQSQTFADPSGCLMLGSK